MAKKPEPTYVPVSQAFGTGIYQGKKSNRQKKKERQQREDDRLPVDPIDKMLLDAFRRDKFTTGRDRKRWHRITRAARTQHQDTELYISWLQEIIDWGSDKSIQAVMTTCENEERWLDYKQKNKSTFQTQEQKQEIEKAISELESDEDEFDG